jgi:hypothetical protein
VPRARQEAEVAELVESGEGRVRVVLEVGHRQQVQARAPVEEEVLSRGHQVTSDRPEGAVEIARAGDEDGAVERSGRVLADERGRRGVDRSQRRNLRAIRAEGHVGSVPEATYQTLTRDLFLSEPASETKAGRCVRCF